MTWPALGLIALGVASLSRPAWALGLDEAELASSLGQPLAVTVPLHISPDQARYVEARLVGVRTTGDADSDPRAEGRGFRASVTADRRGRLVVNVSTLARVLEPYVEFTVEVQSRNLRVQRQFTVFLDPPGAELSGTAGTAVASVERIDVMPSPPRRLVPSAPLSQPQATRPLATTPQPQPERAPVVAPRVALADERSATGTHVVQRGESLSVIAHAYARFHGLSTREAMKRLYLGNTAAFRGSPDRLVAGTELSLAALDVTPPAEAEAPASIAASAAMPGDAPVQPVAAAPALTMTTTMSSAPIATAEASAPTAPAPAHDDTARGAAAAAAPSTREAMAPAAAPTARASTAPAPATEAPRAVTPSLHLDETVPARTTDAAAGEGVGRALARAAMTFAGLSALLWIGAVGFMRRRRPRPKAAIIL